VSKPAADQAGYPANKDARYSSLDAIRRIRDQNDHRTQAEKDRDKILYSSSFRRLATITQVLPPGSTLSLLHNRLTHSLRVSQLGRRFAEHLVRTNDIDDALVLDPERVEAAGLAHDLGHAPFGHIGEVVLNDFSVESLEAIDGARPAGYEGNAQSTRIVSSLATPAIGDDAIVRKGLDLTFGTLAALSKYPWIGDEEDKKWSFYEIDRWLISALDNRLDGWRNKSAFDGESESRENRKDLHSPEMTTLMDARLAETRLMEFADDVTNGAQDIADFYSEGWLDLQYVVADWDIFKGRWVKKFRQEDQREQSQAVDSVFASLDKLRKNTAQGPHSRESRGRIKDWEHQWIGRAQGDLSFAGGQIEIKSTTRNEIDVLRNLFYEYVIQSTELDSLQAGQANVLRDVCEAMWKLCKKHCFDKDGQIRADILSIRQLPNRLKDYIVVSQADHGAYKDVELNPMIALNRGLVDWIASLSEPQIYELHDLVCNGRGGQGSRRWMH
jgi:dGTPase